MEEVKMNKFLFKKLEIHFRIHRPVSINEYLVSVDKYKSM